MEFKGLPEFYSWRIAQSRRDWASEKGELKCLRARTVTPVTPGETRIFTIYTVPTGKSLYWCMIYNSSSFRRYCIFKLPEIGIECDGWMDGYKQYNMLLSPSLKIPGGTTIIAEVTNEDIVNGHFSVHLYAYEI